MRYHSPYKFYLFLLEFTSFYSKKYYRDHIFTTFSFDFLFTVRKSFWTWKTLKFSQLLFLYDITIHIYQLHHSNVTENKTLEVISGKVVSCTRSFIEYVRKISRKINIFDPTDTPTFCILNALVLADMQ